MRIAMLAAMLVLAACAGSKPVLRDEKYVSPFGGFSCGPFILATRVQPAFGPHGGTVRFIDDVSMVRVDVEEFDPALDAVALESGRERIYQGYLNDQIIPLVRRGVAGARLLSGESIVIDGRSVYHSAILLPGASASITGDGRRFDGIRGEVQYTNGRYMYTVSTLSEGTPGHPSDVEIERALSYAGRMFRQCSFP